MRGLKVVSLAPAAYVVANGNGTAVNVGNFSGWSRLVLTSSAAAAATTLDVKIQHSANGTDGWTDSGIAFDQVTDAGAVTLEIPVDIDRFHPYLRVVDTVAGGATNAARAVVLIAKADR